MKKLIFALLMVLSYSAWAEWVLVAAVASNGNQYYIDPATIRREGTLLKYWRLTNLKVRNKAGDMSWRTRDEIDCKKERWRFTSLTRFSESMLGGTINTNVNAPNNEWRDIAPGTVMSFVMAYVCAK
jgi:hypothetical protein